MRLDAGHSMSCSWCPRATRVLSTRAGFGAGEMFYLIGYPLLVVLSPDQLKAVVAHELAHFANGHSRLAGLVYRTRASWVRLAQVLNERGTMPIFVR